MRKILTSYAFAACCLLLGICGIACRLANVERAWVTELYPKTLPPLATRISIAVSPFLYAIPAGLFVLLAVAWKRRKPETWLAHILGLAALASALITILAVVAFWLMARHQEMGGGLGS